MGTTGLGEWLETLESFCSCVKYGEKRITYTIVNVNYSKLSPFKKKNLEETLPLILSPIRKYTILILQFRTSVF